jgi:hypothetical protein
MTEQISALPSLPNRAPKVTWEHVHPDAPEELASVSADSDLSFEDVLKALNPLHHIPVISTIYQAITGDRIAVGPRVAGAALLGGPVGLLVAGIGAFIEEMSGGTVADHLVAAFNGIAGDDEKGPDKIAAAGSDNRGGAGKIVDAAALADMPAAHASIAEPDDAAESMGTELAAISPALLGALPPGAIDSATSSLKKLGFEATDSESKRIARSLLLARRAQADLLFASVRANDAAKNPVSGASDRRAGEDDKIHSNLRPAGAGGVWYADAMQRALDKYRQDATGPARPD